MRDKPPLEETNALRERLTQLEFWWKLDNRFQLLTEAGMRRLIPLLSLETTPQQAAFSVISRIVGAESRGTYEAFIAAIDAHPNRP